MSSRVGSIVSCSLTLGLVGCASQTHGSAADLSLDVQLGVLAAAVQGVIGAEDWTVFVDPRPIDVYHGPVSPDSTHYLSVDASVISDRASVIHDLGASTAVAFPMRRGCTGIMTPPPYRDASGYPSRNEVVWVLAAEAEAGQDEWTLRMISVSYNPRFRTVQTHDAIVIRNENGWVLDRVIDRVIWE